MSKRKIIRVRNDARRRRRYLTGNPLWPLEELYDLRNPPFVADPNSLPSMSMLSDVTPKTRWRRPSDPGQVPPSEHGCSHTVRRKFPIPQLVAGLPWRFAEHIRGPVVPEAEFAPLRSVLHRSTTDPLNIFWLEGKMGLRCTSPI
jgi:hypothetical protein